MTQPALFLAHGSPMNALHTNTYTEDWRQFIASRHSPRAIVCISAHWETRGTFVTGNEQPPTIHDFRDFPDSLYKIRYACPGSPSLAAQISHRSAGQIEVAHDWGLDHGSWSLLVHLFPKARIPVLQISLDRDLSPQGLFELGQSLSWLRDEGVLLIGSGNIVHNIQQWLHNPNGPFDWARAFDTAIADALQSGDNERLVNYRELSGAALSVPTPEHFHPLLVIAGARQPGDRLEMTHYTPFSIEQCSMRSLAFIPKTSEGSPDDPSLANK
jgi:4,5-DOPA dioxygenase extradiol